MKPLEPPDSDFLTELKLAVCERIDLLDQLRKNSWNSPEELRIKVFTDLVLPNIELLTEFCNNIELGTVEDVEDVEDITSDRSQEVL